MLLMLLSPVFSAPLRGITVFSLIKQSRIRCRNTTLVALDLIYKKLADEKQTAKWLPIAQKHQSSILSVRTHKTTDLISQGISDLRIASNSKPTVHTRLPSKASNAATPMEPVTLVIPSAGRSSRFPGHKPKWLLTQPNGRLMLVDAITGLNLENVTRVVVGVLREHVNLHCGGEPEAILAAFTDGPSYLQSIEIALVVIEKETIDQVQTIECILEAASVTGPIFLKDCDNQFACPVKAMNGVATLESHERCTLTLNSSGEILCLTHILGGYHEYCREGHLGEHLLRWRILLRLSLSLQSTG